MPSRRVLWVSIAVIVTYWAVSAARHLMGSNPMPESVIAIALRVSIRAAIVLGVVWFLLRRNGERLADLGLELDLSMRGIVTLVLASAGMFFVANVVLGGVFSAVWGSGGPPPIQTLFRDPRDAPAWIFSAIVGGGFAEELERAFILTRFEKAFGRSGLVVAVIADSAVFGLGHLYQGRGSAMSSGCTGLMLALIFLRRRRVADAMVVHALFDLFGIAAAYALYAR
jgi:membrane protease YdiL (CAAX protease family)